MQESKTKKGKLKWKSGQPVDDIPFGSKKDEWFNLKLEKGYGDTYNCNDQVYTKRTGKSNFISATQTVNVNGKKVQSWVKELSLVAKKKKIKDNRD